MNLNFCSLSSGSSGNCYYLGNGSQGILIDAGISATSIRKFLRDLGIPMETIMGIMITHNHSDHIKGLEVLTRRNGIPAFTTSAVWKSILSPRMRISSDCIREIHSGMKFSLAGFDIEAFPVCHDAPETIGFQISTHDKKITIATDLGHICQTAAMYIKAANLLVIESNYDEQMLVSGRYPHFLKYIIKRDKNKLKSLLTTDFVTKILRDLQYSYHIATFYAYLDDKKESFKWLENAINRGFINYPLLNKRDKLLVNIRGEERFKKLMERVKYEWENFEV